LFDEKDFQTPIQTKKLLFKHCVMFKVVDAVVVVVVVGILKLPDAGRMYALIVVYVARSKLNCKSVC